MEMELMEQGKKKKSLHRFDKHLIFNAVHGLIAGSLGRTCRKWCPSLVRGSPPAN